LRALAALGLALTSVVAGTVAGAGPAQADTQICDKYGSTTVQDRYVVMNNRWGADTPQCINVTRTGFAITAEHHKPTNGAPAAYTAVYYGCHYGNCSPGTNLPMQVGRMRSATSAVSFSYPNSGTYNVSYDIWLDPAPTRQTTNKQELMIWFAKRGPIHPVGSKVASATVDGRAFDVWSGFNGSSDVVSYVAQTPITNWTFDVRPFITDVSTRSGVTSAWYLTSVQAGFEPWAGGTGLAVNSFSVNVAGGGSPPPASSTPPSPSHAPSPSRAPSPGRTTAPPAPAPTDRHCP
jgi:hypothetical protein